jgi:hypothetical protein
LRRSLVVALFVVAGARSAAASASKPERLEVSLTPSPTSWLGAGALGGRPYRLSAEPWLGLLERFLEPYRNHTPAWRALLRSAYGPSSRPWVAELHWSTSACTASEEPLAAGEPFGLGLLALSLSATSEADLFAPSLEQQLVTPRPEPLPVARAPRCFPWQAPLPVTFRRQGGESDRIALLDCEGSVSSEALDRVSVLARPAGVPRPALPLPFDPEAEGGEWVAEVRLLNPRLLWAVSRIAESFRGQPIEIVSGYRRGGHEGNHARGLAMDLVVHGVPKEAVFQACRKLQDAGCGYYPAHSFIHVDVRAYGSGRITWVDASGPGEPSRYVEGWPGVLTPSSARSSVALLEP